MIQVRGRLVAGLLLAVALAIGQALSVVSCRRDAAPAPTAAAEARFDVGGMTCASCAVAVRLAAMRVGGVFEARVDRERNRAWVTYDPERTDPARIAAAITAAGYPATPRG